MRQRLHIVGIQVYNCELSEHQLSREHEGVSPLTSVMIFARPGEPKYIESDHSEPWNRLWRPVRLLVEDALDLSPG